MEKLYEEILMPIIGALLLIILKAVSKYVGNIKSDLDSTKDSFNKRLADIEGQNINIKEKISDLKDDLKDLHKLYYDLSSKK